MNIFMYLLYISNGFVVRQETYYFMLQTKMAIERHNLQIAAFKHVDPSSLQNQCFVLTLEQNLVLTKPRLKDNEGWPNWCSTVANNE